MTCGSNCYSGETGSCSNDITTVTCSCGCSPCQCGTSQTAAPTPFYNCGTSVQETHCKPVFFQSFATAITTNADFVIPDCGVEAIVTFNSLSQILIGSYIWNPDYGYFKVTAFDYQCSQVTILNECFGENAAPGTVVKACTLFAVSTCPCLNTGCFSVDTYGAKGDGTTDDSAAIQAAIDAACVSGGVVCFTGGKTYLVEATLNIPITADHVTLTGYGAFIQGAVNDSIIRISDLTSENDHATNINILGLTINGSGYTDTQYPLQNGVEINSIIGCALRDVNIWNIPNVGLIGTKSPAAGAAYWNQILWDHISVRFCGYQGVSVGNIGNTAAGDDLTVVNSMFNHCGEKLDSNYADGAVYLKVITLSMSGCEVSGNYSISNAGFGYRFGVLIRTASGLLADMHYEGNGNDQAGSADLMLDSDAHGLVISGSDHFGSVPYAPKYAIKTTCRGNKFDGIHWCGDAGTHVYDYIIECVGATDVQIGNIQNYNNPQIAPGIKVVNYAYLTFGGANLVAHDHYVRTGRRIETFQSRYSSTNPVEIVLTGWGDAATVTSCSAQDTHGDFTVNSLGTGQTTPATIDVTFADGAFDSIPTLIFYQRNHSAADAQIGDLIVNPYVDGFNVSNNDTVPIDGRSYVFSWILVGNE